MKSQKKSEKGFSLIEVIFAIVILTVGVLAMVSVLTASLVNSYESEKRIIAKQIALSTVESIMSAKEINRIDVIAGWNSIRNVQGIPDPLTGIFLNDWKPIREENGWDGIAGTVDDACDAPGVCAVSGRTTNTSQIIKNYERRIVITDVPDSERPTPPNPITRRRIDVTVRFFSNRVIREETISTIIANYK